MPKFNITKESMPSKSFRVESLKSKFDLNSDNVVENFQGEIDIEDKKWNIGVIYGSSGTGKSTIAKECFKNNFFQGFEYKSDNILDDMPKSKSMDEISKILNAVGFSSPPSWLKPYSVLSNGQKMRVDLARAILEENDLIVFDEFTSVVDRQVARYGSFAIQKAVRKMDKKFIAVSCHSDILEWLEPDWTYCTDTQTFFFGKQHKRPEIQFKIYESQRDSWNVFRKYHYLSHTLQCGAKCFVGTIEEKLVAFCAVMHFMHPINKKIKKIHRLVVLPDYQGIGIGIKMANFIGSIYTKAGFDLGITTSNPAVVNGLKRAGWICTNFGRSKRSKSGLQSKMKALATNRYTISLSYPKEKNHAKSE